MWLCIYSNILVALALGRNLCWLCYSHLVLLPWATHAYLGSFALHLLHLLFQLFLFEIEYLRVIITLLWVRPHPARTHQRAHISRLIIRCTGRRHAYLRYIIQLGYRLIMVVLHILLIRGMHVNLWMFLGSLWLYRSLFIAERSIVSRGSIGRQLESHVFIVSGTLWNILANGTIESHATGAGSSALERSLIPVCASILNACVDIFGFRLGLSN